MARRRSQNRRASRRTMNITELDQDSDLINTHDAMWWKNIEGDLTVNPLRRSFFEETTEPILDGNSFVDSSELRKEWWKTLDRTNVDLSRGSSPRKSARRIETPHESSDSDDAQTFSPQTRSERSAGAANSTIGRNKSNVRERSAFDTQGKSTIRAEDPHETSVNTSFDLDVTFKSRLRPFKKRFAKAPGSDFRDTWKDASPTEANDTNKSLGRERTPIKPSEPDKLMGPPKPPSSRKKLSSISRKLNLTEDESEGEAVAKKPKLGSTKKTGKAVSMDPSDEPIENSSEPGNSDFEHRRSNLKDARSPETHSLSTINETRGNRQSGAKNRSTSATKDKSKNRLEASENSKNVQRESVIGENSQSQRIEEPSDHEYEKNREKSSSPSSLVSKILEVSLTRISPRRKTVGRRTNESDRTRAKKTEKAGRTLRSSKRIIIDSPYELPDQERSGASQISDSESEKEKSRRRNSKSTRTLRVSLRSVRSKNKHESVDSTPDKVPRASTSRRSARINHSRTRIFSDDDISIEDLGYLAGRDGIVASPREENIRVTRKSSALNRSPRNIRSDESTSEKQVAETTKSISKSLNTKENIRGSLRSQTPSSEKSLSANKPPLLNESDVSFSDDEPQVHGETRAPNLSSRISRRSRKSIADDNYRDENEEIVDREEMEEEIPQEPAKNLTANKWRASVESSEAGKSTSDSRYLHLDDNRSKSANKTARESRKIVAETRSLGEKSRQTELFVDSEDESEMAIMDSRSNENSRTSRGAGNDLSRSGESVGENERSDTKKVHRKSGRSDLREKSVAAGKSATIDKSRGFVENDETSGEDEIEETEKSYAEAINSHVEKSHASQKNPTADKSQRRILSDDDKSESEPENARETEDSRGREKSRPTTSSLGPEESEKIIETDESFSEDEAESMEKRSSVPANLRKSKWSFNDVSSQENSRGSEANELDATSREKNVVRSVSTAQESNLEDIIDEDDAEDERRSLVARETANNARASKSTWTVLATTNRAKSSIIAGEDSMITANNSLLASKQSGRQRKITDFVPGRFLQKIDDSSRREIAKPLDPEKWKLAMQSAEEMKKRVLKSIGLDDDANKKAKSAKRPVESTKKKKLPAKETTAKKVTKVVDKAYIVNGVVYKRPKLPRPSSWATDRLYRHLWKLMEPKFGIATRVKSEKFVVKLSKVVALAVRRKKYENYKLEVDDLMMKMARLGIIETRNDFYDFCYDFLPYDFRVKTTPILLPGNINSIPYDPTKLHTPLLEET